MEEKYWFSFIKLMIKIENIIEIVNFLSTLSKNNLKDKKLFFVKNLLINSTRRGIFF